MDLVESLGQRISDEKRHPWEHARLEYVTSLIRKEVPLQAGSCVLDIGCGDTFVVERLAAQYPQCSFYAIDTAFTDEIIHTYSESMSVTNVQLFKSVEDALPSMQGKAASLILLMDVIEHIEDDIAFLEYLRNQPFSTTQTRVLITVPALQSLFCSHDVYLGHYRRYTNGMLQEHVERSNYILLKRGYFFFALIFPRVLQVIAEKYLGVQSKPNTDLMTWNGSPFVTKAIMTALRMDILFTKALNAIGINCVGLSNYCICQPNIQRP